MTPPACQFAVVAAIGIASLAVCGCDDAMSPAPDPARFLTDVTSWDAATSDERRAAAKSVAARETDFRLVRLETFISGGATHEVAVFSHAKTGLEFVLVPGGTFAMGSPADDPDRFSNEAPHTVTLTRPFLVCRTECTQAAWCTVGGTAQSKWRGATLPVECVSWDECDAWCRKAGLDLPTEAQWEWACRAGATTRWCFGEDESHLTDAAWFRTGSLEWPVVEEWERVSAEAIARRRRTASRDEMEGGSAWPSAPDSRTHPVAEKRPNTFGLHDVHGNVWEWCADRYADVLPDAATDPRGAQAGDDRVARGGGWSSRARRSRAAVRGGYAPGYRAGYVGFRPAKNVGR